MNDDAEWLEADGLGGFASGTASGIRTRRYHALLLAATTPPAGRFVLVNGVEVHVETSAGRFALASQRYAPDVVHPDGARRITEFSTDPWPRWTFVLEDGTRIEHEIFVRPGAARVFLAWRLVGGAGPAALSVRPLLSGRDPHALHHENPAFRFDGPPWRPYDGVPAVHAAANGEYVHEPVWYRRFQYDAERARGLDFVEDLASPGTFRFDLGAGEAALVLATEPDDGPADRQLDEARTAERGAAPPSAPTRARRRRVPRPPGWREDDHRRLSVVRGLGPRHVHRAPRPLPRDRPHRGRARDPRRVGRGGLRRHAAEPLPRPRRDARVQRGRRVALARDRGLELLATGRVGPRDCRTLAGAVRRSLPGYAG
jgi:hypothetical protein